MDKQRHIKVFIADDHPIVVQGIKCTLADEANISIVGVAASSGEMFKLLSSSHPTVLLLDINMPGLDYHDNILKIKKEVPWAKIVVFSEYYTPELVKSLFQAGICGYVSKESKLSYLTEAINTVVTGETYISVPGNTSSDREGCQSQAMLKDDFRKRLTLSRREREILELISKGLSSQGIGKTLFISKHTVATHRKNILRKLDFNTSTELVRFAVQQGLVQ